MPDRSDGLTIRFQTVSGGWRRLRLEPRSDGQFDRFLDRHNGCKFVPVGHDILQAVEIEGSLPGAAVLEEVGDV